MSDPNWLQSGSIIVGQCGTGWWHMWIPWSRKSQCWSRHNINLKANPGIRVTLKADPWIRVTLKADPGIRVSLKSDPGIRMTLKVDPIISISLKADPGIRATLKADRGIRARIFKLSRSPRIDSNEPILLEPVLFNVYGAPALIPRNEFRQPM